MPYPLSDYRAYRDENEVVFKDALDFAATHGHLEIVKYLNNIGAEFTTDAMDGAARNGYLEIVKFLNSVGAEFTTFTLCMASAHDQLEIVKYFIKFFDKECIKSAISWASINCNPSGDCNAKVIDYLNNAMLELDI